MTRTSSWALVIVPALGLTATTATAASAVRRCGTAEAPCGPSTTPSSAASAASGRDHGDPALDLDGARRGSEVVLVVRTFVSDDPRLPIEKGAGTTSERRTEAAASSASRSS